MLMLGPQLTSFIICCQEKNPQSFNETTDPEVKHPLNKLQDTGAR